MVLVIVGSYLAYAFIYRGRNEPPTKRKTTNQEAAYYTLRGQIQMLSQKEELKFTGIPNFAPEHFRKVILKSPLKTKQLQKGLLQLAEEGAVQVFRPLLGNDYILGAVGILQFDVIISRLKDEYAVDAIYQPVNLSAARWVQSDDRTLMDKFQKDHLSSLAYDSEENLAILVDSTWRLEYIMEQWPDLTFHTTREKI